MSKILTISIAGYNVEDYISHTLDSLLLPELLSDIEILVCDDGGNDKTAEIVKEYHSRFPDTIFLVHKKNGGYGSVINTNIKLAKGRYFKQLDGDDWFVSENLKSYIEYLKHIDSDYVITPIVEYYEDSSNMIINDRFESFDGEYDIEKTDFKKFSTMHESTFKTSILKDSKIKITEHCFYTDTELVISPLPYLKKVSFYKCPIYVYRLGRDGQSVSLEGIKKHYKEHETVFWNNFKVYEELIKTNNFKAKWVNYRLKKEVATQCKYFCVLPYSEHGDRQLKNFIYRLNNSCPDLLKESMSYSRLVKILVKSNYLIFPLYHLFKTLQKGKGIL